VLCTRRQDAKYAHAHYTIIENSVYLTDVIYE